MSKQITQCTVKGWVYYKLQPHPPPMHPLACPTCCVRRVSFFCPVPPPCMLVPHSQRACQRADSAIIQLLPLLLG